MTPRRPQYARRAQEDRDIAIEEMSDLERDIERFQQRHKDWFTPRATFSEVMEKLQVREFFEEFRNGDVKVQSWQSESNGQQHIAMVRDRLLNK